MKQVVNKVIVCFDNSIYVFKQTETRSCEYCEIINVINISNIFLIILWNKYDKNIQRFIITPWKCL